MVDVGDKTESARTATARGTVHVGSEIASLIKQNLLKKGDVLSVAQLAGIMGAKKTAELIPLCHNINLTHVEVSLNLENESVAVECTARSVGKTGVEMEALTGVAIAALTVYDMCKAVSRKIRIETIFLVKKTGGSRGDYNES
ncbi:hypothetical protein AAG570_011281 [Ranatra chinensis]|uniref:cyclic pyranopterin monophosphate synthase n=1 Tax=Ranatra chinensis TaxID=642074 RepID=A0ABD0Z2D8_9HEMI